MNVLIVDDIEDNRVLQETVLRSCGYTVESANNGVQALEITARFHPDIIISDILMPEMDGYDLCREVKKNERLANKPFVFYTSSYTESKDKELAMALGASAFIVKPIETEGFLKIIKKILDEYKGGSFSVPKRPKLKEQDFRKMHEEILERKLSEKDATLKEEVVKRKKAEKDVCNLSQAVEQSPASVIITDKNGIIKYVNPKFTSVTGYSRENVIGETPGILKSGEKSSEEYKELWETITSGKEWRGEFHNKRKDGQLFWEYASISPIIDKDGTITHFLSVKEDITERKKIEQELHESEIKFRAICDTANDAIIMSDNDGNISYWNKAAERMFGYSSEEIIGKAIHETIVPGNLPDRHLKGYRDFKDTGHGSVVGKTIELSAINKEGTEFPIEFSLSTVKMKGKWCAVSIIRDITERKKTELELRKSYEELGNRVEERTLELSDSKDKIDSIVKSIADGLIVTDTRNRIILMNHVAEKILGIHFSEVINRPIDYAIQDDALRDRIMSILSETQSVLKLDFELPGSKPNQVKTMLAAMSLITDANGKPQGVVTIISDVTQERELDRMKTEFLSTAAHELRTPLTSIQGFSEIILTRDNISPEERKKFLTYINNKAVALSNIVSDLLDISRIESGRGFVLDKQPCKINNTVMDLVKEFQDRHHKSQLNVVMPEKPIELRVDREKISQVLENLLSNAVKYSPEGGTICITGKLIEDYYQLSVEDHGMGMTPEQVEKAFDKFYRADASNSAIEGTGLGMNIVKYIVEAHKGNVWIESEFGKGTTVTFRVPV